MKCLYYRLASTLFLSLLASSAFAENPGSLAIFCAGPRLMNADGINIHTFRNSDDECAQALASIPSYSKNVGSLSCSTSTLRNSSWNIANFQSQNDCENALEAAKRLGLFCDDKRNGKSIFNIAGQAVANVAVYEFCDQVIPLAKYTTFFCDGRSLYNVYGQGIKNYDSAEACKAVL